MFLKTHRSFLKASVSLCKSTYGEDATGGKRGKIKQEQDKKILHGFENYLSGFLQSPNTWGAKRSLGSLNSSFLHDYLNSVLGPPVY